MSFQVSGLFLFACFCLLFKMRRHKVQPSNSMTFLGNSLLGCHCIAVVGTGILSSAKCCLEGHGEDEKRGLRDWAESLRKPAELNWCLQWLPAPCDSLFLKGKTRPNQLLSLFPPHTPHVSRVPFPNAVVPPHVRSAAQHSADWCSTDSLLKYLVSWGLSCASPCADRWVEESYTWRSPCLRIVFIFNSPKLWASRTLNCWHQLHMETLNDCSFY